MLHAMYRTNADSSLTHDEVRKAAIAAGEIPPLVIGDLDLDAGAWVTGVGLGYSPVPEEADRLRWGPMLADHGVDPRTQEFPPNDSWFPWRSWPSNIEPPNEGSLGAEDLEALLDVLAAHSVDGAEQECIAYYGGLAANDFDSVNMYRVRLRQIPELLDVNGGRFRATPSNFWPVDRSWFVWTDWDLLGTKVSGAEELVLRLDAHPGLEVIDWRKREA
ncbi:hypothetical protein [Leifsonia sp. LS-T14]|uniref:hypothetical protein n=1 Tax=unclassified Leifsonia TaxID=2663824 RepID=UPI0035A67535